MTEPTLSSRELPRQASIFERLFDKSPDAIAIADPEGRITSASQRLEQWFGYSSQELIGQPLLILVPNRYRVAFASGRAVNLTGLTGDAKEAGLENLGRRKDGSEFPVDMQFSYVESSEGRVAVCIFRDVSSPKNLRQAIPEGEPLYRTLFEFSPDAIIASDRNGSITEVNARVESMFGYARGELVRQSIEILVPERFRHAHPAHRNGYTSAARVRPMGAGLELYGRRKDGSEFPADIMLGPVETGDGPIVLGVIRDLTEKGDGEDAWRRSEQQKRD